MGKKTVIILSCIFVAVILALATAGVVKWIYPTHYGYRDSFIIGNNAESIQEKYGEFSHVQSRKDGSTYIAGYLLREADYSFFGNRNPEFYIIKFDENEIAYEVEVAIKDWSYREYWEY